MSDFEHFLLVMILTASVCAVVAILELVGLGQPPRHCRYFVPVQGHAHIYSCSEYPRPVKP